MKTTKALLLLAVLFTLSTTTARADEVTDWKVRSYGGFSEILQEIKDARVFAGIHFRSACNDGQQLGAAWPTM